MDDILRLSAAASAAGCAAIAVLAVAGDGSSQGAREWLRRRARRPRGSLIVVDSLLARLPRPPVAASLRLRLRGLLELADWREGPEQFLSALGLATVAVAGAAALGFGIATSPSATPSVVVIAAVAVPGVAVGRLLRAGRARQRRLRAELTPMLELVGLELSGGATPSSALESVLFQSDCELASALRTELILSRVAGSPPFEARVSDLARRLDLLPLESLAMVLSLSRDYGSGVGHGLKALATDLRRVQRRELIAESRGALNRVLLPAAIGVLLPFMAILLFPALSTLWSSFQ